MKLFLILILFALFACEKECYQCRRFIIDYKNGIPTTIVVVDTFEICNETDRQIERYIEDQTDSAGLGCNISRKCWVICNLK